MPDKTPFTYDDLFPDRWLYAEDLQGQEVNLKITAAYQEDLRLPGGAIDTCGILSFAKTKKEYVLNKTNAMVLVGLWGKDSADYVGHHITIAPIPDESGKSRSGYRILFVGSSDLTEDVRVNQPQGGSRVIRATKKGRDLPEPVDPETGEVQGESSTTKPQVEGEEWEEQRTDVGRKRGGQSSTGSSVNGAGQQPPENPVSTSTSTTATRGPDAETLPTSQSRSPGLSPSVKSPSATSSAGNATEPPTDHPVVSEPDDLDEQDTAFLAETKAAAETETPETPAALKASKAQVQAVKDAARQLDLTEVEYLAALGRYGVKRAQDLSAPQADLVLEDLGETRGAA